MSVDYWANDALACKLSHFLEHVSEQRRNYVKAVLEEVEDEDFWEQADSAAKALKAEGYDTLVQPWSSLPFDVVYIGDEIYANSGDGWIVDEMLFIIWGTVFYENSLTVGEVHSKLPDGVNMRRVSWAEMG